MKSNKDTSQKHSISIAALLYGLNTVTVAAGFVIIACWSVGAMRKVAQRQLFHDLAACARMMIEIMETRGSDGIIEHIPATGNFALRVTLVSQDGTVVSDTATDNTLENHLNRKEIAAAFDMAKEGKEKKDSKDGEDNKRIGGWDIRKSTVTGEDVAYYAMPVTIDGKTYALRLASPVQRTVYYTWGTRTRIAVTAVAVLAAVLFLTYLASAYIVHGINLLRKEATELMKGDLDCHLPFTAPREVLLLQEDMEKMAHEVKRLEQVRKDFVANVSHELKTPVTAIIGFSETLLDEGGGGEGAGTTPAPDDEVRRFLEIINSQGKRLMAIIEDLLTLSRLERDSRRPEMMKGEMNELTRMVCNTFFDRASERGMSLSFCPSGGTAFCMINARLYEEALGNIIDNAIKYCPEGSSIVCKVYQEAGSVRVAVEDDGAGIPEALRERIFERFFRIDKGRSREMGGTGLGLSIAAHIVKAHSGTLKAESRKDGKSGAVFVMELPRTY